MEAANKLSAISGGYKTGVNYEGQTRNIIYNNRGEYNPFLPHPLRNNLTPLMFRGNLIKQRKSNVQLKTSLQVTFGSKAHLLNPTKIVAIARNRILAAGTDYAYKNSPTSPLASLTGNIVPLSTHPKWLQNKNKCNQFIGDILTFAGFHMPTFKMKDGTEHYVNAERLLQEPNYFSFRQNMQDVKPGDIIVIDRPQRGENGAHVEIVTEINLANGTLLTAGALKNGATESNRANLLKNGRWKNDARKSYLNMKNLKVYFLRPAAASK